MMRQDRGIHNSLKKKLSDWVKEHPDAAKKMEMEEDEWMDRIFEDDNIRELK